MSGIHDQMRAGAGAGANEAGAFFSSTMSGFFIGFGLDWWLGTRPVLIVIGIVAGAATGFWKMWQFSESVVGRDEQ